MASLLSAGIEFLSLLQVFDSQTVWCVLRLMWEYISAEQKHWYTLSDLKRVWDQIKKTSACGAAGVSSTSGSAESLLLQMSMERNTGLEAQLTGISRQMA